MGSNDSNRQKDKKNIWILLLALCVIGAVIAVAFSAVSQYNKERALDQLDQLAEDANAIQSTAPQSPVQPSETPAMESTVEETAEQSLTIEEKRTALEEQLGIVIPQKELDFDALHAGTNPDIYAWITIPDTQIDYPVLQHPTDNSYYLEYNLDGTKGYPGCIYSEDYNTTEFTDPNTVLYGHNMKNGSMFAGLHSFEDSQFFEEHPYVYIYTPEQILVYEIFAAYVGSNEHILYSYDFTNSFIFQKYLNSIMEQRSMNCNLRQDLTVTSDDHILTLSTCIANKANNRYLVQAVLVNPEAVNVIQPEDGSKEEILSEKGGLNQ